MKAAKLLEGTDEQMTYSLADGVGIEEIVSSASN